MNKKAFWIAGFLVIQFGCNSMDRPYGQYKIPASEVGIVMTSSENVQMDSIQLDKMTRAITQGDYPNVHSVLIARNGKLIYEKYFPGKDEILGDPIGMVNHHKDTLHDIRSITKSVVSACIGIAIAQEKIKSIDQKIWDYFPEFNELNKGEKSNITIRHLLTMTTGLQWNENIPYTDPANSEIQMNESTDAIRFVLSRNSIHTPGTIWNYNGGSTQVLAAIIKKVSGLELDEYAKEHLFTPLGIRVFSWSTFANTPTRKNVPLAASGLRLRSRDLLKFGLLYMSDGIWNKKRILPENWVADSHKTHIRRDDNGSGGGYGFQFWTWKENFPNKKIHLAVAVGNGDQRIFFDHENDLLVVTTAGNYNQWDIKNNTGALLQNFIYPSIY